jgi:hypothetical protein
MRGVNKSHEVLGRRPSFCTDIGFLEAPVAWKTGLTKRISTQRKGCTGHSDPLGPVERGRHNVRTEVVQEGDLVWFHLVEARWG